MEHRFFPSTLSSVHLPALPAHHSLQMRRLRQPPEVAVLSPYFAFPFCGRCGSLRPHFHFTGSLCRSVYVQSVHQVFDIDFYIFYFQEFSFWKKKIKYAGHVSFLLPTHVSSLTFRDTPSIIYISYLIVLIPEIFKDVWFFLWTLAHGDWFLCAVCV